MRWTRNKLLAIYGGIRCFVSDRSFIGNEDIEIAPSKYLAIFRELGQITFELSIEENQKLVQAAHQFKEIEKQPSSFDRNKWVKENIDPTPEGTVLAVFSFMIVVWGPTTIIENTSSREDGYRNVLFLNKGFAQ